MVSEVSVCSDVAIDCDRLDAEFGSKGQREAAQAIGMTHGQTMRYVILPQSVRIILLPLANNAISLLKDTSVASLISAPELMLRAHDLTAEYYMPMQLYLIAGAMYFIMAYPLSIFADRLERFADRGHRGNG